MLQGSSFGRLVLTHITSRSFSVTAFFGRIFTFSATALEAVVIAVIAGIYIAAEEIFNSVKDFYRKFYFRAPKIAAIGSEMIASPRVMRRRQREAVEFFQFLRQRHQSAH